jgi:hypothetical protein
VPAELLHAELLLVGERLLLLWRLLKHPVAVHLLVLGSHAMLLLSEIAAPRLLLAAPMPLLSRAELVFAAMALLGRAKLVSAAMTLLSGAELLVATT